jgi:hypothetical protein
VAEVAPAADPSLALPPPGLSAAWTGMCLLGGSWPCDLVIKATHSSLATINCSESMLIAFVGVIRAPILPLIAPIRIRGEPGNDHSEHGTVHHGCAQSMADR